MRILHIVWALIGIVVSIVLVSIGSGHPPPIIFLPVALVIWAAGHVALWGISRVAARGKRLAQSRAQDAWPLTLKLVLLGTGIVTAMTALQLLVTAVFGNLYPYRNPALWTGMLAVGLVHAACFFGVLLRKRWSRALAAGIGFLWVAQAVVQIIDHLVHASRLEIGGLLIVAGFMTGVLCLSVLMLRSSRIRSFLAN
jgi:hypothetical protein